MRANAAGGPEARISHLSLAAAYSRRIEELVGANRGGAAPLIQLS